MLEPILKKRKRRSGAPDLASQESALPQAQDTQPSNSPTPTKIKIHTQLRIATLNCRGINDITKRQEIQDWMSRTKTNILILTETKTGDTSQEGNDNFSLYFSSKTAEHSTIPVTRKGKGKGDKTGKGKPSHTTDSKKTQE